MQSTIDFKTNQIGSKALSLLNKEIIGSAATVDMCNTGWATNTYREVWAPFGHFINVVFPALNKFVWQVT